MFPFVYKQIERMFFFSGVNFYAMLITIFSYFNDTRVKRSEVRRKLACRRIFDLGTRQKHE